MSTRNRHPRPEVPEGLPPELDAAMRQDRGLLNVPIRDLPPETRKAALKYAAGALPSALDRIMKAPVKRVLDGLSHEDDRRKLMRFFEGGETLEIKDTRRLRIRQPRQEDLADVEQSLAELKQSSPQHHAMNWNLYCRLSDPRYIIPIVTRALDQFIAHDLIFHPFDAGAIRYSRLTTDLDKPVSEDAGCILTFHPPVDERGEVVKGLNHNERVGRRRVAVSFIFRREEHGMRLERIVKNHPPAGAHKIGAPYNARLHIVPPSNGEEEYGYPYRIVRFAVDPEFRDVDPASPRILAAAAEMQRRGGANQTTHIDGGEEYLVVGASGDGSKRKAIRKAGRRSQMIYDVEETHCPQVNIGSLGFGIWVPAMDAGVRQAEQIVDIIHDISVREYLWARIPGMNYVQRKTAVMKTVMDIVEAVPEIRNEPPQQRNADIRRFMFKNRNVIVGIIALREEMNSMRVNDRAGYDRLFGGEASRQIPSFSAPQFYHAAARMIQEGGVLNVDWPFKDLQTFVGAWNELPPANRSQVLRATDITEPIMERLNAMVSLMQAEHQQILTGVHEEGERTRGLLTDTYAKIKRDVAKIGDDNTLAIEIGRAHV